MFEMKIDTDNAAFEDNYKSSEVARILREMADKVESEDSKGKVIDINGNVVGIWRFL